MKRTLLEFCVEHYLNRREPLPRWLAFWVRRNSLLQQMHSASERLDSTLRQAGKAQRDQLLASSEAPAPNHFLKSPAELPRSVPARVTAKRGWTAALALAASLAVAFWSAELWDNHAASEHAEYLATQLSSVPGEVQTFFNQAARTSQTQVSQCSLLTNVSLPRKELLQTVALEAQQQVEASTAGLLSPWHALRSEVEARWPGHASDAATVDAVGS